jgi:c-di-GMP-binding flagellar brake protein YcgR
MSETRLQSPSESAAQLELLESDSYKNYLLHSATEIQFVLRSLNKATDLITAYFNEGNDFLLTTLLDVDDAGIVLDYGASDEMNRKALAARKLILVATHDRVKIQFAVPGVEETEHEGRPAFRAPLPQKLLRLQRREYYRLMAPVANPLKCELTLRQEDGTTVTVEAQVLDISGGGIAVMTAPSGFEFSVGQHFKSCTLELPEIGTIHAGLRVCNLFDVTLRNGTRSKRCGCQFLNLSGAMVTMVERYIMKVERERKARGVGT